MKYFNKNHFSTLLLILSIITLNGCSQTNSTNTTDTEEIFSSSSEFISENTIETESIAEEYITENNSEYATETETEPSYTYTDLSQIMYATSTVNVRDLPEQSGTKLGTLSQSDEVEVIGQCNETKWYRIVFNNSIAYVSNNYLITEKPTHSENKNEGNKSDQNDNNDLAETDSTNVDSTDGNSGSGNETQSSNEGSGSDSSNLPAENYHPADTNKDGWVSADEEMGYITPEKQACINAGYGVVVEMNGGEWYAVLMKNGDHTIDGKSGRDILREYLNARGLDGHIGGCWINPDYEWYWFTAEDIYEPITEEDEGFWN